MRTTEPPRVSLYLILLIAVAFAVIAIDAEAGGDRDNIDIDVGTDVTTGDTIVTTGDTTLQGGSLTGGDLNAGDVNTGGNKALALSNSLGDVDIAGCLGSTQWATPLFSKQKLTPNWACLAEVYLRTGKYKLAAIAFCNTEIRKEFDSEQECRDEHDFEPILAPAAVAMAAESTNEDEEDDYHLEQQMAFERLENELEALKAEPAQRVIVRPDPELEKRLDAEAERRAKARAILKGEK